jgi:hypothetical protein
MLEKSGLQNCYSNLQAHKQEQTEHVIALNWKEDTIKENINITVTRRPNFLATEDDPSTQIHNSQGNRSVSEALCRTSNRPKKLLSLEGRIFMPNINLDSQ